MSTLRELELDIRRRDVDAAEMYLRMFIKDHKVDRDYILRALTMLVLDLIADDEA